MRIISKHPKMSDEMKNKQLVEIAKTIIEITEYEHEQAKSYLCASVEGQKRQH
jgi:hypothetical protein